MRKVTAAMATGALSFLSGCASVSSAPEYEGVKEGVAFSTIVDHGMFGVTTTTCQLPGLNSVCSAYISLVEEKRYPFNSHDRKVVAGSRRLRLVCMYWTGGPMIFGKMDAVGRELQLNLEPAKTYLVRGEMADGTCSVWLADSADGKPL